ncbi:MAG: hypothetical protein LC708_04355, partial [Actinobacteria bacterium]|nr:hypothetical protein [Actinomycetota bacterium]
RTALGALITSLGLVAFLAPTPASAAPKGKTTICHATGSATNPYVEITVSNDALAAHRAHQDGLDIIPASPVGCPGDLVIPPPPPVPGPVVLCVVSAGVTQTATTVTGTPGDDTIDCTNASPGKTIDTFGGNDTITGTRFDDVITSGDGNDTVTGLGGNDVIAAGEGNNTVTGGEGNDVITAGAGSDTLTGSAGNDFLDGGFGSDTISGGDGNDTLIGPNADGSVDTVSGGAGTDTCTPSLPDGDIVSSCP